MTLLVKYLFKQFTKNLALILTGFVGIYLLVDFFERIDNFLTNNLPLSMAVKYFLCKTPLMVERLLPISIMLAGIITVGLLHHNRELLSLQAAGISLARIIRPIVLAACIFTLFGLASSQWLLPSCQATVNRIWYQDVSRQKPTGILRNGMIFYRGSEGFYTVGRPQGNASMVYVPFSYIGWDQSFGVNQLITARKGSWKDGKWQLTDGIRENGGSPETLQVKMFSDLVASLPEGPDMLLVPPYKEEELSLSGLYKNVHALPEQESNKAKLKLNEKLSFMSLGIPLLLVGLPVLLVICRGQKRDLSIAIPTSCLLAFMVWGLWSVLQSLAKTAYIPIPVAAWLVHVVIIASGTLFLLRLSRT